jgi:hypothetical protein
LCGICKKSPGDKRENQGDLIVKMRQNDRIGYSVYSALRKEKALICFSTAILDPNNMLLTLMKYTYFMIVGSLVRNVKNCYSGDPDA